MYYIDIFLSVLSAEEYLNTVLGFICFNTKTMTHDIISSLFYTSCVQFPHFQVNSYSIPDFLAYTFQPKRKKKAFLNNEQKQMFMLL